MPNDIMTSVLSFFKSVDDKLEKLSSKQDNIKDDISEIKTELAILKVNSVTNEQCEAKHKDCLIKLTTLQEEQNHKSFWTKELPSSAQIIALCAGIGLILLVLMGALNANSFTILVKGLFGVKS